MTQVLKRATRSRTLARPLTPEQELQAMREFAKSISSSKKNSVEFLKSAGILNKSGKLAKQYRSA